MEGMVKVLHVVFQMNRGGMESRIMDIYRAINRMKISFDFLEHTSEPCEYDNEIISLGGKIYKDGYTSHNLIKTISFLKCFFDEKENDYNYIHIHESYLPNINLVLMILAKKSMKNCKFIIHSRSSGGPRRTLHNIVKIDYCRKFDYYITCSKEAAYWMFPRDIVLNKKYITWNNSIDAVRFRFDVKIRNEKRKQLKIENKFVIGHVGAFKQVKNHDFLLEIFVSFIERRPDSVLLLIGGGLLKEEIQEKVKENKLENKVIFMGVIADVADWYQAMDVFLLPSYYEGLPGVGVEAQASGLPCIFSDRITKEVGIVTDRVFFETIDQGVSNWVLKLDYINKKTYDRDTFQRIRDSGFDCKTEIDRIEEFYQSIF